MDLQKKIVICIGTDTANRIRARLSLLLLANGVKLGEYFHSINLHPGADLATYRSANEAHLADANGGIPHAPWPAIPDEEWAKVETMASLLHTPEVIAASETLRFDP